ncbi:hypothetical protein C0J45_16608 [Silurus meridionalis]|uniref:Endonuclease/exonuclease/phosphatase domain-containing protein n=1 Tax=Silurus meridionalis TaxID=175797 RepID=A0A8T0AKG5_SILME|nr:hypothetical protein HF521_008541 [Silurus meridionalis]KAI5093470.1 hypothetical protein C0J45_16608 [Silurus meridionalis]
MLPLEHALMPHTRKPVYIEKMRKRSERFGMSVSPVYKKFLEEEKLKKRNREIWSCDQCRLVRRGGRCLQRWQGKEIRRRVEVRVGTLNVGTMTSKGREVADMVVRRKVDMLCVQETKWKGSKARNIGGGFKLFYHGVNGKRNGVGVILKEEYSLTNFTCLRMESPKTRALSGFSKKDLYRLARQRDQAGKDVLQVRAIKDGDGNVLTSEVCTSPLFLKIGTSTLLLHSSGILSPSKILLNNLVKTPTAISPKNLHASTGMSSGPNNFPLFILLITALTVLVWYGVV